MTKLKKSKFTLTEAERIISMAWEDRTPFDAIKKQFGLSHDALIQFMRAQLANKSFIRWRKRTNGRATKLQLATEFTNHRFRSSRQREITGNRISKR